MKAPVRTLLLVVAVLALPFVAGGGLYLSGWRPAAPASHGRLIAPPADIAIPKEWHGRWSLALLHAAPCEAPCQAHLEVLGRLRLSLGEDGRRVQAVWLDSTAPALRPARVGGGAAAISELPPGSVVLIDPNGLAVLRYAPDADLKGMRADLKRLLQYSWNG